MSNVYSVTFCGHMLSGFSQETVEQDLLRILGHKPYEFKRLFSGDEIVLQSHLSLEDALSLKMQLENIGLMVAIADSSSELFSDAQTNDVEAKILGLGIRGRIGRLQYIDGVALYSVVFIAAFFALLFYMVSPAFVFISIALFYVYQLIACRLAIVRLHDLNLSGWFVFLVFIPGINVLMHIYLILAPGDEEANQYGEVPERGTYWGICYFLSAPMVYLYFLMQYSA